MTRPFRVMVLGGYGHFGSVISRTLARSGEFQVCIAGRDGGRARALGAEAGADALQVDLRGESWRESLAAWRPQLVIHTAGPFQGQDYRVAQACLEAGAHYVDLADARDFVCGIEALDAQARAAGLLVVAGASSVPALCAAVVDSFRPEFASLRSIDIGIAAAAVAPGEATARAVLGYCGKPFEQWQDGSWTRRFGWQGLRRRRLDGGAFARWFCDCDVPDLQLLPARYGAATVRFGAGVELLPVQWGLWSLSWLVRAGVVRDASVLTGPLLRVARALERFGTGRSAMFVAVSGQDAGGRARAVHWELVAEGGDGSVIPAMAAVALARKLAAGRVDRCGAMPCVGLVTLGEYLDELRLLRIRAAAGAAPTA